MDRDGAVQTSIPSTSGTRKEKKKQVKDEFDRLRQAEKKRRRLEKALATSAAIRSELEKKKLKKIEEQQRLDDEIAAIAEAVALHVLADEDSEEASKVALNKDGDIGIWKSPYFGILPGSLMADNGNTRFYWDRQQTDASNQNNLNFCGDISYYRDCERRERLLGSRGMAWQHNDWNIPHWRVINSTKNDPELVKRELVGNGWGQLENLCLVNQKIIACDEKTGTVEVSASLASAQAVAAPCITEEVQIDAKATKTHAQTTIARYRNRNHVVHKFDFFGKSKFQSRSGMERDLHGHQLHETELKPGRKHCRYNT